MANSNANNNGPAMATIALVNGDTRTTDPKEIVTAQFNPESLQISYTAKNGSTGSNTGGQNGETRAGTNNQRTGVDISVSSVTLLFDTTREGTDVRENTLKLAKFIMTGESDTPRAAPTIEFQWGTLLFRGTIDGITETLEYFSENGVPMRATVALQMTLTPHERDDKDKGASSGRDAGVNAINGISEASKLNANAPVGTTGLTIAQAGESIQAMAARTGQDWKAIAAANDIDNPRFLQQGSVINMKAKPGANPNSILGTES